MVAHTCHPSTQEDGEAKEGCAAIPNSTKAKKEWEGMEGGMDKGPETKGMMLASRQVCSLSVCLLIQ